MSTSQRAEEKACSLFHDMQVFLVGSQSTTTHHFASSPAMSGLINYNIQCNMCTKVSTSQTTSLLHLCMQHVHSREQLHNFTK